MTGILSGGGGINACSSCHHDHCCLQAHSWHRCITRSIELTQVYRQNDEQFIALLQNIRIGRCPPTVCNLLIATASQDIEKHGIRATKLYTHKEDVHATNTRELQALEGTARQFVAQDSDPQVTRTLDVMCPVGQIIELKVGAQVKGQIQALVSV